MIGFNALGKLGLFANQMFQFSALKGIAKNRGFTYCIPPTKYKDKKDEWQEHQLFNPFKLKDTNLVQFIERPIVQEETFTFNENLFNNCPDDVDIRGYFQTEKYFKHIRDELLHDFTFKDEILKPCNEMMNSFETPPVALHIRRTDYITNPNHTALDISYYEEALKEFGNDRGVIVFSDDTKWCHEHPLFSDDRFLISDNNSNYVDMCLMTMCNGHIIANSSFSWWGAWLSNSEKIIAPSGWFKGSNNQHLDTKDIIPEKWIIV